MNKCLFLKLSKGNYIISQSYLGHFLMIFVFFLLSLFWKNNLAYAQQASDLLSKDELPLIPTVTDSVFQITQQVPESSKSTVKKVKKDRSGWALTPVVGTLGIGANLSKSIIRDSLNFRGGFSAVVFDDDVNSRGVSYDGDLRLSGGIPLVIDWFPLKNWFRISGGLVFNRNRLRLGAEAEDQKITIDIGDQTFERDLVGRLNGQIQYTEIAPYIGFGISNPVGRGNKFSFFLELGAMFQGRGEVSLNADGPIVNSPAFQEILQNFREALEREIGEIENDTFFDDLPIYPVLQLGFSYQF